MRNLLFPVFALLFGPQAQAQDDSAPESPEDVVTNLHENGCPRLPQAIRAINEALNEAMLDEAVRLAEQAAKATLCQPLPINPLALTGVFHMKGAVHTFRGETAAARDVQAALYRFGFGASALRFPCPAAEPPRQAGRRG